MADQNTPDTGNEPDYLSMSDEEMLNTAPPVSGTPGSQAEGEPEGEDEAAKAAGAAATAQNEAGEGENEGEGGENTDPSAAAAADADAGKAAKEEGEQGAAESAEKQGQTPETDAGAEKKDKQEEKPTEKPTTEDKTVDFEAEYKKLLAPFKANGREVKVDSVDDAIALMQMGANYNKKMAALKPNLKLMKLLENNGLLDEGKLSFLIDLEKKNPQAINKLVKDAGINPLDLDADKAGEYQPKIHTVDDRQLALDTVLEDLQDSPAYARTLQVVSKEWDGQSKQVIAAEPQLLKVLHDHVASGVYDLISKEIERERMFGRLDGVSDIEAYKRVGDAIQARGGFNHLAPAAAAQKKPADDKPVVVAPKAKPADDGKLNDKRRAAAPARGAAPSSVKADFNPLALSDEEFAKLADPKYR